MGRLALVSRTRSSHGCSAGTYANFGFKGTLEIICLLVSLWFGSSLRYKLRMRANFRTATLGVAGLFFALATPASAQTDADYPNRPIRIIVSVAAGGGVDLSARIA